uniref:Basic blue protein n=1 Tax=Lotus japonicus TaxID=34305 RepID=I3SJ85_LOTJA|nr:unknown [Lotus japonicus]
MAQGRGKSSLSALILLCCMLLHCCDMAYATTYTVGDQYGWKFFITNWTEGKSFEAGDILVFNYSPLNHNVVVVDANGYKNCNAAGGKVYNSGHDSITLPKGQSYYISSFTDQCQYGSMKMAVYAA